MMGPIKRYVSVLKCGFQARKTKRIDDYQLMYSEWSDVSMLRLFECFLESAPQLVLQLHIMILVEENDYILTGISACFSLLSLSWAIVAYTRALRAAANVHRRVSWAGALLQSVWRCGMMLSRLTAILMFSTVFKEWTLLFLGLHWLLMTVWLFFQDTDFCHTWWEEKLFNVIIGVIYVFSFFNMKEGRSRWRVTFYYTVVLVENSAMILAWWPNRTMGKWYNIPALCTVWGGFLIGMICMILYYMYFHPGSKRRCHCCSAWKKLSFLCYTCCCNPVDTSIVSPYKKVKAEIGLRYFASTDSSEDELDPRDFTELRDSYEQFVTCDTMSTARVEARNDEEKPASSRPQDTTAHNIQSLDLSVYDQLESNGKANDLPNLMVIGDAKSGFRVKQLNHNSVPEKNEKFLLMPLPNATSTPGDELKPEASGHHISKVHFDDQSTPIKPIKKGSPNTLVKNWVKKTQEIYRMEGGLIKDQKTEDNDISDLLTSPNLELVPRRIPLRMKSFSKKDRLGPKPIRKRKSIRNSFREAFGFKTVDLDRDVRAQTKVNSSTHRTSHSKPAANANVIRSRVDQPPIFKQRKPADQKVKKQISFSKDSSEGSKQRSSQTKKLGALQENVGLVAETAFTDACPQNRQASKNSQTVQMQDCRASARKKLAFKERKQAMEIKKSRFANEDTAVTEAHCQKPVVRRVLGSIENQH